MGEVYEARLRGDQTRVALKVLTRAAGVDDHDARRLRREAELLRDVDDPCLARVLGFLSADACVALVSELLDGETLQEHLKRLAPLPWPATLRIARPLLMGLDTLHERGILHRDIKPSNVFLLSESRVKLIDFGLARLLSAEAERTRDPLSVTAPGAIAGTTPYISPERLCSAPDLSPASDMFSFGCVLYEMLSGSSPFARATHAETIAAILGSAPVELPRRLPDPLAELLAECLCADPRARPSARAALLALRDISARVTLRPGHDPPSPTPPPMPPLLDRSPESDDTHFRAERLFVNAQAALAEGRAEATWDAIRNLRFILTLDGSHADAHALLAVALSDAYYFGWCRADQTMLIEARSLAQRATALAPESAAGNVALVHLAWHSGTPQAGLHAARSAMAVDPKSFDALEAASSALIYAGLPELAIPLSAEMAALYPRNWRSAYRHAEALQNAEQFQASQAVLERFVSEHPGVGLGHELTAINAINLGDVDAAIQAMEVQYRRDVVSQNWLLFGELYARRGATADAYWAWRNGLEDITYRLRDTPGNLRSRLWSAMFKARLGQADAADADVSFALECEPRNSYLLYRAACVDAMNGAADRAAQRLEAALESGFLALGMMRTEEPTYLRDLAGDTRYLALRDALSETVARLREDVDRDGFAGGTAAS